MTGKINLTGLGTLKVTNALVLAALNGFTGTASGTLNVTSGTVQANTIIAGGGSSTINVIAGTLIVTNTAGTSGALLGTLSVSNATLTLPATSTGPSAAVSTLSILTLPGTADTINISSVPPTATFPSQYPVIAFTTPSGTLDFTLGTLPPPYQGYISNNTASVDLVITNSTAKNDTWNGNLNSGKWDTTTLNWLYLGSPVGYLQGDPVTFDDTLTGTPNVTLTLNVTPSAIGFNNSANNYVLSGAFKITGGTGLTKDGTGSVRLSESGGDDFSGGITVNNGTLILDDASSAISGGLLINGGTVQIGNNDANGVLPGGTVTDDGALVFDLTSSVTVSTAIDGSGTLTQSGSGTLTLSGANAYTGNTTVGAGTLALSGSGTLASSAAVSVNNATFDISALSQPTTLNSLTLSGATNKVALSSSPAARIGCTSLSFGGAANHLNVSSLPPIASYPVTFTIIQSVGAASGAFNFDSPTLPGGYGGNVAQSGDQTAVLLNVTSGPIGVRSGVFWIGADVPNLNTNWSDRLNWQLPGVPGSGETVFFTPTAAQTVSALSTPGGGASALNGDYINNIVDANVTISSLTFTNADGSYHNTLIKDGLALTMTNTLTVGSTSADFGGGATEFVTIAGPNGTLQVNNTNGTLYVGLGSGIPVAATKPRWTCLRSAPSTPPSAGCWQESVAAVAASACSGRTEPCIWLKPIPLLRPWRCRGTETSDTSASAIAFGIGDNDGNASGTSYLYLGQTNAIFADAIGVSRQKQSAQMLFNPAFTLPAAYFRGQTGGNVATWSQGDGVANGGSSVAPTGIADFTGGTVDARISTMYVGRAANDTTGSGTATGTLTFDGGLFDVTTLYLGYQPTNVAKAGVGTMNVVQTLPPASAPRCVVRGNLNLGVSAGGTGATGTLNLTNGTVLAYASCRDQLHN